MGTLLRMTRSGQEDDDVYLYVTHMLILASERLVFIVPAAGQCQCDDAKQDGGRSEMNTGS